VDIKKSNKLILLSFIGICYTNVLLAGSTQSNGKNSKEQEIYMPRFLLDYAVVDHSLKNNEGYSDELLKLWERNPHAAIFLSEFWHQKAYNACRESIHENINSCVKKITLGMTEEEKDKITEPAKKAANQCFYSFYYDNWDEINKTIINRLRAERIFFFKRQLNKVWLYLVLGIIFVIASFKIKKIYGIKRPH
jgi:hypothetical protein